MTLGRVVHGTGAARPSRAPARSDPPDRVDSGPRHGSHGPAPTDRPAGACAAGSGAGRGASGSDRMFRWLALAAGLLVLVDPRADRVLDHEERVAVVPRGGLRDLRRQLGPGEGPVRRRGDDLRHLPRRHHRARDLGAGEHRHRAVRHRDRAASRSRKPIIYVVDLLAAIPSVVYGLWALARADAAAGRASTQSISDGDVGHPDHR